MKTLKQYCVYEAKGFSRLIPYLIVLQYDGLYDLNDVVAAPVVKATRIKGIPVLNPKIEIDAQPFFVQVEKLSALNKRNFGELVGDFDEQFYEFTKAIDRLFSGI